MRRILFWMVWNVPLGKLTPYILGLAIGSKPIKKKDMEELTNENEKEKI